jgi:hypothetical protein
LSESDVGIVGIGPAGFLMDDAGRRVEILTGIG